MTARLRLTSEEAQVLAAMIATYQALVEDQLVDKPNESTNPMENGPLIARLRQRVRDTGVRAELAEIGRNGGTYD